MMLVTFFTCYFIFYLSGVGYETVIINGKITRRVSWKYPAVFALFVWLIWHFYLFPFDVEPQKTYQFGGDKSKSIYPKINVKMWN